MDDTLFWKTDDAESLISEKPRFHRSNSYGSANVDEGIEAIQSIRLFNANDFIHDYYKTFLNN